MIAMLRHNLWMKVLALALALAMWGFTRAADPIQERPMQLEVKVRVKEGAAVASRLPDMPTMMAYVRGRASQLNRVEEAGPKAVLDARGIQPGEARKLRPRLEPGYRGVTAEFGVSVFEIAVDNLMRAEFPPEEVSEGGLQAGYFIDSRIGLPASVVVEGAASLLERADRVVYYLNYSALAGSTELSVEFHALDEDGCELRLLSLNPATADIGISLQQSQAAKRVPVVVDYQGTPAANYAFTSMSSDPFLVEVSGPPETLGQVLNVHTAPINLTGKTSSFQQSVALLPPAEGVSLSVTRATVSVEIEQISSSVSFDNLLIDPRGMEPMFTYALSPERVRVTISGGVERVAQVTADLIRPQVDVAPLTEGTHQVRVSVALPSAVRLDSVEPSSITVLVGVREGFTGPSPSEQGDEEEGSGGE